MAGPTNTLGGYNSWEQNLGDFYSGSMTPPTAGGGMLTQQMNIAPPPMRASSPPSWTSNGPAMYQMQQELARAPATRYAVGSSGQRLDPIPLGYGSSTQSPAVAAATQLGQSVAPPFPASADQRLNARTKAAERAFLEAQASAPGMAALPRLTPGTQQDGWTSLSRTLFGNGVRPPPVGANPGLGGALIGDGQMNPGIPAQLPPADGSSPLPVWAGDNPQQGGGQPLGISVRGGQPAPRLSPAQQYAMKNYTAEIAALQRQAAATGQTGTTIYKNGQKVGNVGGGTSAQAYEQAAAKSRDRGTSGEGGNPSWW